MNMFGQTLVAVAPEAIIELVRKGINHPLKDYIYDTVLVSALVVPFYFCCVKTAINYCKDKIFPKEEVEKLSLAHHKPTLQPITYLADEPGKEDNCILVIKCE